MSGVETRAQQQENGSNIWLMVSFSGPFKVSVDRTWVPRDQRKVLKNIWSMPLPPVISVCSQALLQANLFPFSFHCAQLSQHGPTKSTQ